MIPKTRESASTLKFKEIPGAMVERVYIILLPSSMVGTMLITEIKVSTEPAIDQNSLTFSLFLDTIIRIEVTRTMRIGKRGCALSIIIGQPFISLISLPSMCLNFLKIRMIIASAIAASTAAIPIMKRVNIIP